MTSKTFFLNLDWTPHPSSTLCRTKFKPPPSVNIICKESSLKGKVPQSLVLLRGEERGERWDWDLDWANRTRSIWLEWNKVRKDDATPSGKEHLLYGIHEHVEEVLLSLAKTCMRVKGLKVMAGDSSFHPSKWSCEWVSSHSCHASPERWSWDQAEMTSALSGEGVVPKTGNIAYR